jgi:hypothetical protein
MPLLPADANRIESAVEATMDADGKLDARLAREYFIQAGVRLACLRRCAAPANCKKAFEREQSRRLGGITLWTSCNWRRPGSV